MDLNMVMNGNKATIELEGRIDAKTAPEYEKELLALPKEIKALDLDFKKVSYISSAGLRMITALQQQYDEKGGSLKIIGARDEIIEIFEVTGFNEFLNIEY
ncbi:MAG: STAS domain-containing protein [Ruminococcus sp.]|nr:STAS domain-containing protein [Ruminococcus sp.]MBR2305405.1 STAS domain-containing protein [Ruminococcus sp.]